MDPSLYRNNWDSLKHRARTLELEIESKIQTYGKQNSIELSDTIFESETEEIRKLLNELNDIVQLMSEYCSQHAQDVTNRVNIGLLQRTRIIYTENLSTFKRLMNIQKQSIQSKQLLSTSSSSRRGDEIDRNSATAITDTMLRERSTLSSAQKAIDSFLEEANSTKETLHSQHSSFLNTNQRLQTIYSSSLPIVSNLLSSITTRRNYNQTVLSIVIAIGIFFFLYWFILRHI